MRRGCVHGAARGRRPLLFGGTSRAFFFFGGLGSSWQRLRARAAPLYSLLRSLSRTHTNTRTYTHTQTHTHTQWKPGHAGGGGGKRRARKVGRAGSTRSASARVPPTPAHALWPPGSPYRVSCRVAGAPDRLAQNVSARPGGAVRVFLLLSVLSLGMCLSSLFLLRPPSHSLDNAHTTHTDPPSAKHAHTQPSRK